METQEYKHIYIGKDCARVWLIESGPTTAARSRASRARAAAVRAPGLRRLLHVRPRRRRGAGKRGVACGLVARARSSRAARLATSSLAAAAAASGGRRGRILPTIRSGRSVRGSRVGKQTNDGEGTADEGNRAAEGTLTWLTTEPAADDPAPPLSSNEFVGSKLNESSSLLSADCRVAGRGSRRALTFLVWAGGRKGRFFSFSFLGSLPLVLCGLCTPERRGGGTRVAHVAMATSPASSHHDGEECE